MTDKVVVGSEEDDLVYKVDQTSSVVDQISTLVENVCAGMPAKGIVKRIDQLKDTDKFIDVDIIGGISDRDEVFIIIWKKILGAFSDLEKTVLISKFFYDKDRTFRIVVDRQINVAKSAWDDLDGIWDIMSGTGDDSLKVAVVFPASEVDINENGNSVLYRRVK